MKTSYSAAQARNEFAQIISSVAYGGLTITINRYGKPIAKIIPTKNFPQQKSSQPKTNTKKTKTAYGSLPKTNLSFKDFRSVRQKTSSSWEKEWKS